MPSAWSVEEAMRLMLRCGPLLERHIPQQWTKKVAFAAANSPTFGRVIITLRTGRLSAGTDQSGALLSCGAFNPHIDFATERAEVDWLG